MEPQIDRIFIVNKQNCDDYTVIHLEENQIVYINDNESFVRACKDSNLTIIKCMVDLGYKYDIIDGFKKANNIDVCRYLLTHIDDVSVNDYELFKIAVKNDNVEMLDMLVTKNTSGARSAFDEAVFFHKINILDYLYSKGFFWDVNLFYHREEQSSVYYSCLLHAYCGNTSPQEKEAMYNTYNWLEKHGAKLHKDHIQKLINLINDVQSLRLIRTTINNNVSSSDNETRMKIVDYINLKIHGLVDKNDRDMITEYLRLGINPSVFLDQYLRNVSVENFDILFMLMEAGCKLESREWTKLIKKLISENMIEQLRKILSKIKLVSIKDVISVSIEHSNLETNMFLHSIVNYNHYFPCVNSLPENNSVITTMLQIGKSMIFPVSDEYTEPKVDSEIFANIYANKNIKILMPWLISLGYLPESKQYFRNVSLALIHNNSDYVIYGLDNKLITIDDLKTIKNDGFTDVYLKIKIIIDNYKIL